MEKGYNNIDLARFIMAIFVIAIHTRVVFYSTNAFLITLFDTIVQMANPFFFLSTGFLLGKKMENRGYSYRDNLNIQFRMILKYVKMYIVFKLIYIPLAVLNGYDSIDNFLSFAKWYLLNFIFYGSHFGNDSTWYLVAVIYALFLIYIFYKCRVSIKMMLLIAFLVGPVLQSVLGWYYMNANPISELLQLTIKNGRILYGIFYIPCGIYISQKDSCSIKNSLLLFTLGFVLLFVYIYFGFIMIHYIPTVLYSVGAFGLILKFRLKDSKVYYHLRRTSFYMFLVHVWIWSIINNWLYGKVEYGMKIFIIVTFISVLSGFLLSCFDSATIRSYIRSSKK